MRIWPPSNPTDSRAIALACDALASEQLCAAFNARAFDAQHDTVYLTVHDGELAMVIPSLGLGDPVKAQWARLWRNATKNDPLIKAIGKKAHSVIDLSGGLGSDSGLLLWAGYVVSVVERNPYLAAVMAASCDSLTDISGSLAALYCDQATSLLSEERAYDVAYFDPVYTQGTKRTAKPKRAMQAIRSIATADDDDARKTVVAARARVRERVVVKRAPNAPQLMEGVHHQISSKSVRFDIYLPQR